MARNDDAIVALGGIGCILIVLLAFGPILGAFVIPYDINSWLVWAGRDPSCHWYHGALLGLIPSVSYWATIAAIITFILSFFF